MLVREDTGRFVTQREVPRLCMLRTELQPLDAPAAGTRRSSLRPDAALVLHPPPGSSLPPLRVPLASDAAASSSKRRRATVWGFTGDALDEGDEAADWCSRALAGDGAPPPRAKTTPPRVRLVRHAPELRARTVDPDFALPGTTVGFADEFPVLAATEGSLRDLNARFARQAVDAGLPPPEPLVMARFRPNLVFAGGEATTSPWADDEWARVRVGGTNNGEAGCEFAYVKPCSRCKVTTVDPATGEFGPGKDEPLGTLRGFRSGAALGWAARRPNFKHALHFAWNVQPVVAAAAAGGGGGAEAAAGAYEAYTGEEPLCVLERGSGAEVVARRAWE